MKDKYRIYTTRDISTSDMDVLMTLYQPLIGGDAILVYLTLFAESRNKNTHVSMKHARLMNLMNSIQIDTFEHARMKLEEYMLLRTFVQESDSFNTYLYMLQTPLSASDFLSSSLYVNRYIRVAQKKTYEETINKYGPTVFNTGGYQEITVQVKNIKEDDFDNTVVYTTVKPKYKFQDDDSSISFDYDRFLSITDVSILPTAFRTPEILSYIGKVATVYGIDANQMSVYVSKAMHIEANEFDFKQLLWLCERNKTTITKSKDPYDLPPASFLQSKQNGAELTYHDKKILERLSLEMHFSPVVINIMIEYILKESNNVLVDKFVDMVAGEWARDGVSTKEQAIEETKKVFKKTNKYQNTIKVEMPEYMRQQEEGTLKTSPVTKETLEKAKALQKKLGGE